MAELMDKFHEIMETEIPENELMFVVRCKDCFANGLCSIQDAMMWSGNVTGWDYCSHGKRKTDESE